MDDVCPPSTCFAAYNRYGERSGAVPKDVTVYPYNGHEGGGAHQLALQLAFMSEVLG